MGGLDSHLFILQLFKGCCYGNQFCGQIGELVSTLALKNGLQDHSSDFRGLNVYDSSTLFTNMVRFGIVTLEFMMLECVQQASVIVEVSLTTFVRGYGTA